MDGRGATEAKNLPDDLESGFEIKAPAQNDKVNGILGKGGPDTLDARTREKLETGNMQLVGPQCRR
jgi:hypothetical protein